MSDKPFGDLDIAFSPCPNDTFIFHALITGAIDAAPIRPTPVIEDVEELNSRAFARTHEVTKLSFYTAMRVKEDYEILDAGAALGYGCGPLVVANTRMKSLKDARIAVPGRFTTAYLLLRLWQEGCENVVFTRFDDILPGVAEGRYDAGLIIHEGRFVYPAYNCVEIIDLGKWWESETGLPIPLGCIALRRDLMEHKSAMEALLRKSIEYARENPDASKGFIASHAQEMDDQVIRDHIALYVNDFTLSLGLTGARAIEALEERALRRGVL